MSINETVVTLSNIHQALQESRVTEAALQTMEALEAARLEEEAYEEYLEARQAEEFVSIAEIQQCINSLEEIPF